MQCTLHETPSAGPPAFSPIFSVISGDFFLLLLFLFFFFFFFLLVCTSYMHVKIFFITSPRLILNRLHYSFVRSKLDILHPIVSFVDEMNIF